MLKVVHVVQAHMLVQISPSVLTPIPFLDPLRTLPGSVPLSLPPFSW